MDEWSNSYLGDLSRAFSSMVSTWERDAGSKVHLPRCPVTEFVSYVRFSSEDATLPKRSPQIE